MKFILIHLLLCLLVYGTKAQTVVELSKVNKVTQEGVEITQFEGKPFTGYLVEHYPNGKPKTWITMKDGLPDGQWQEWLENGMLRLNAYWKAGKGHGLWQYFYNNGALRDEESYLMDIPNGIARSYHNNGTLKTDYFWLNGKKHGVWTYYSENGLLLKTEVYDNNTLISTTE